MCVSFCQQRGQAVEVSGGLPKLVHMDQAQGKEIRGKFYRQVAANMPDFVLSAFIIPSYKPMK